MVRGEHLPMHKSQTTRYALLTALQRGASYRPTPAYMVCAENTHCCAASSLTSYAMIMIIRIVMQNENMLIEDDMYLAYPIFVTDATDGVCVKIFCLV